MRAVGAVEWFAMVQALEEAHLLLQQLAKTATQAAHATSALWEAGHDLQAQAMGTDVMSASYLDLASAGAKLEAAAVGFLGERRNHAETLAGYLGRLAAAVADRDLMAAMQASNGLRFDTSR